MNEVPVVIDVVRESFKEYAKELGIPLEQLDRVTKLRIARTAVDKVIEREDWRHAMVQFCLNRIEKETPKGSASQDIIEEHLRQLIKQVKK